MAVTFFLFWKALREYKGDFSHYTSLQEKKLENYFVHFHGIISYGIFLKLSRPDVLNAANSRYPSI